MKMVLQKFIAQSGYCSRRQAESFILNQKVKINGNLADLGARVDENDEVEICGKKIELKNEKIYLALNKPVGYTCTNRIFKGEKNIFSLVRAEERLFAIGRLDKDSRGLVLLTNDGDLTQKLSHPKFEHEKEYLVKLKIKKEKLKIDQIINSLKYGVDIGEEDGVVKVKSVEFLGSNKFKIILTEGKKRQIRRMFRALDFEVEDLVRTRIGKFKLGKLKDGEWKRIELSD